MEASFLPPKNQAQWADEVLRNSATEQELIILHVAEYHGPRISDFMSEQFNCVPLRHHGAEDLVFFQATKPSALEIAQALFVHPYFMRTSHMIHLGSKVSASLDFLASLPFTGKTIRAQIYPRSLKQSVLDVAEEKYGAVLAPHGYSHFLSVVQTGGFYYYSLLGKEYLYVKDEKLYTAKNKHSRAYYKVKETIDRFHIPIQPDWRVIDVGASPGGITLYLSQSEVPKGEVIAIDPADLTLKMPPNVRFLKMKAQDAVALLKNDPEVDMIVCDINERPWLAMTILAPVVSRLRQGGYLMWTIKLPVMSSALSALPLYLERVLHNFKRVFPNFPSFEVKYLLSNRYERTLVAKKEGPDPEVIPEPLSMEEGEVELHGKAPEFCSSTERKREEK